MAEQLLLYDYKRDGGIKPDEVFLVKVDGSTQRVSTSDTPGVVPGQRHGDSWSPGETICFIDGWSFGINDTGETICLGTEAAIKEALANPKLKCGNPDIDAIIDFERNQGKETEHGTRETATNTPQSSRYFRAIQVRGERVRPIETPKYRAQHVKRLKI